MNFEEFISNPNRITKKTVLKTGEEFLFRLLKPSDTEIFGNFPESLSQETNKRYQPHPLTKEAAKKICHTLDYKKALRLVGIVDNKIVAYFLLDFFFAEEEIKRYRLWY